MALGWGITRPLTPPMGKFTVAANKQWLVLHNLREMLQIRAVGLGRFGFVEQARSRDVGENSAESCQIFRRGRNSLRTS
jgi:hypothetical protein